MLRLRTPLNIFLIGLSLAATLAGYALIPWGREIAVRWGFDLQPTQTAPAATGLLHMPAGIIAIVVLSLLLDRQGNADRSAGRAQSIGILIAIALGLLTAAQLFVLWRGLQPAV